MEHHTPIPQSGDSQDSSAIFAALRDALATLYPIEQDARLAVDDAGMIAMKIAFSPRAQTNWHHILAAALDQARLDALLEVILGAYPHHPPFTAAYADYRHLIAQGKRLEAPAQTAGDWAGITAQARFAPLPVGTIPPPTPLPLGSRMPFSVNPLFVGRETELMNLAKIFQGGQTVAIGQIAAATGLGGIGKTQLAVAFVHHYGQYFAGGIHWLNFADPNAIPAEIAACGIIMPNMRADFASLDLETQVRLVLAAWQSTLPRLLVFDNCEDDALLAQWRPTTGGSRVLITSRRSAWDVTLGVSAISLDTLARVHSITLLRTFCPYLTAADSQLDAIAAELGDLPLALHLAGSYLARYRRVVSPEQYLTQLRQPNRLQHRSLQGGDLSPTGHVQHVARTFALSYEQLRPNDPVDALARALLMRAAWFASGQLIPHTLLLATMALNEENALQAEDALQRLANFGLVEIEAEESLRIHRLVAHFVQQTDTEAAQIAQSAVAAALLAEANRINDAGTPELLLVWQSHLRHITEMIKEQTDEQASELCTTLGYYLYMIGDFAAAKSYYERALAISEIMLGEQHPSTAAIYDALGLLLKEMGDYTVAKFYLERALLIRQTVLGEHHSDTAGSYNDLGILFHITGGLSAARFYYEQALTIYKAIFGEQHRNTATTYSNLGTLLHALGEWTTAKRYLEHSLRIRKDVLGEQHLDTAFSYSNLALLIRDMSDYATAKRYSEHALAIREAILGQKHPYTANSYNILGIILMNMGDYAAARIYIERGMAIREELLGYEHHETSNSYQSLGVLLRNIGDYATAQSYLERALTINESVMGKEHPSTARSLNRLGELWQAMGEYPTAKIYFERALAIYEKNLGSDHPTTSIVQNNLADLEQALKRNY